MSKRIHERLYWLYRNTAMFGEPAEYEWQVASIDLGGFEKYWLLNGVMVFLRKDDPREHAIKILPPNKAEKTFDEVVWVSKAKGVKFILAGKFLFDHMLRYQIFETGEIVAPTECESFKAIPVNGPFQADRP